MKLQTILTTGALALSAGLTLADSGVPTGKLEIDSSLVRNGSMPNIEWEIEYPQGLEDIVTISDPGSVILKRRTEVEIRVAGVAFQSGETLLPVALQAEIGNGGWTTLFSGTSRAVDASEAVYSQVLEAGTTINLSATGGTSRGGWSFSANTLSDSPQVTHLREGDFVPDYVPAYNQGNIVDYLSGFVSSTNAISAGPRDVVYLFELGTTRTSSSYFDMQDVAVVITFKDVE